MILKRYGSTPLGTFGKLEAGGKEFATLERPWMGNRRFVSCVPLGKYELLWRETTTPVPMVYRGYTWYLYNEGVGFVDELEKHRYNCCIHIGNTTTDVSGCIAIGVDYGTVRSRWGVIHSRTAMELLYSVIGPGDTSLEIVANSMG